MKETDCMRAGWASVDCTPPLGLPMGGRGTRFTPGATVLDPLRMQALLLRDADGKGLLLLSMDMIGLSGDMSARFRREIAAHIGLAPSGIVLNFSHTHSGPMSGYEGYATDRPKPVEMIAYEETLLEKACALARAAQESEERVSVRWHRGTSHIGINRRARNERGEMALRPNPTGYYNPDLWVLDVIGADGRRCVAFSYGCHPVIVYGYAWDGISADFPGVCRRVLQEALGQQVQAQFVQGLAGNVRPRLLANVQQGVFEKGTAESVVAVGRELAGDVLAALETEGDELALDVRVRSTWVMVERDQQVWPLAHWQNLCDSADEMQRALGQYWRRRLQEGPPPVRAVPWEIGLLQLAPAHRITFFSGEALAEWLPLLRRWLADEGLVAWGYCQDGRCYMPTDALLDEGGYEVMQSNVYNKSGPGPFAKGIDNAVRSAVDRLSGSLVQEECNL